LVLERTTIFNAAEIIKTDIQVEMINYANSSATTNVISNFGGGAGTTILFRYIFKKCSKSSSITNVLPIITKLM
jgi:hypothetical protein